MDFSTFTQETLAHLWRKGDIDLEDAMPKIVRTAESRLRTDLKMTQEDVAVVLQTTTDTLALPDDLDVLSQLVFVGTGSGRYVTQRDFHNNIPKIPGAWPIHNHAVHRISLIEYTIEGGTLLHRQPASVEAPAEIKLIYTPKPASLVTDDDTIYNLYPDLYEKCVYTEALEYLLEEERRMLMEQRYLERLDAVMFDQSNRKFAGAPLKMQMPRRDVS